MGFGSRMSWMLFRNDQKNEQGGKSNMAMSKTSTALWHHGTGTPAEICMVRRGSMADPVLFKFNSNSKATAMEDYPNFGKYDNTLMVWK